MSAVPNPSVAQARVLVDELVRNAVVEFVVAPGSRSAALAMAAADHPQTRVWVEIDERSAAFFALGVGKASGHPAAVITTSGTAVANLAPAVVEAGLARVPLLLLTADRPPELRDAGANQTIDQIKLLPARWFFELGVAEDREASNRYWRSIICRAVTEAKGGITSAGAVHLNIPFREPLVPLSDDGRATAQPFRSDLLGRPGGQPWTVGFQPRIADMELPPDVVATEKGLIVVGEGGPGGLRRAEELAAHLGWPLIAEATAGGRPAQAITTAHHLFAAEHEQLRPEVALIFGRVGLSRNVGKALSEVPRWIVDPGRWTDPDRTAAGQLQAWPRVTSAVNRSGGWRRRFLELERIARDALDSALDAAEEPTEPRTARDVSMCVPNGGTLFVGSSMPIRDVDWFMPARDIRVVANRGASGVDGWVSTALGVAAASDRPVVALGGDLSVLHDSNGFLLTDRPDCVFVIVSNDGGGIFSFLPQAGFPGFERIFGIPHGRDLAKLAAFHDMGYEPVTSGDGVIPATERALAAGGVWLVEVKTERYRNVEVHRELTGTVTAAVEEYLEAAHESDPAEPS